jgi:hypothetical protein
MTLKVTHQTTQLALQLIFNDPSPCNTLTN